MSSYLLAHALTVVTTLASIVVVIRLLGSRRTAQSTIAWLLAIVFAPLAAIPLYLALGSRKFPRRAKTSSPVALASGLGCVDARVGHDATPCGERRRAAS